MSSVLVHEERMNRSMEKFLNQSFHTKNYIAKKEKNVKDSSNQ